MLPGDGGVDPGLQAERTSLAWQRTALSVGAVGALLLHAGGGHAWAAVPAALGIAMALALLVLGKGHYGRAVRLVRAGRSPMAPGLIANVSSGVTVLALAAIVLLVITGG